MKKFLLTTLFSCYSLLISFPANAHIDIIPQFIHGYSLKNINDVITIPISLSQNYDYVMIQALIDSTSVNMKSFYPNVALWRSNGSDWSLITSKTGEPEPLPGMNSAGSGLFLPSLSTGSYLFSVSTDLSLPNGTLFNQGFKNKTGLSNTANLNTPFMIRIEGMPLPVPEPETYALMGIGLLGLLTSRRYIKK